MVRTPSEFDLFKRRIVCVIDYFDDENEVPWNFVMRAAGGKFEAVTTALLENISQDDAPGVARERSLGIFDTCADAVKAIHEHEHRVDIADCCNRDAGPRVIH